MRLHISSERAEGTLTVRVAGRLGGAGLDELRRACSGAPRLRLDLRQLHSADETGTALLASLRDGGAELLGVPPYIDLLMRARQGPDAEKPPDPAA